nr:hypothetical protein [Tanacetum cinerariifolium]
MTSFGLCSKFNAQAAQKPYSSTGAGLVLRGSNSKWYQFSFGPILRRSRKSQSLGTLKLHRVFLYWCWSSYFAFLGTNYQASATAFLRAPSLISVALLVRASIPNLVRMLSELVRQHQVSRWLFHQTWICSPYCSIMGDISYAVFDISYAVFVDSHRIPSSLLFLCGFLYRDPAGMAAQKPYSSTGTSLVLRGSNSKWYQEGAIGIGFQGSAKSASKETVFLRLKSFFVYATDSPNELIAAIPARTSDETYPSYYHSLLLERLFTHMQTSRSNGWTPHCPNKRSIKEIYETIGVHSNDREGVPMAKAGRLCILKKEMAPLLQVVTSYSSPELIELTGATMKMPRMAVSMGITGLSMNLLQMHVREECLHPYSRSRNAGYLAARNALSLACPKSKKQVTPNPPEGGSKATSEGDWIKVQKKGKGKDVLDNRVSDLPVNILRGNPLWPFLLPLGFR